MPKVEIKIQLPDDYVEFAQRCTIARGYPKMSDFFEDLLGRLYLAHIDREYDIFSNLSDELKRRIDLPADQWIKYTDREFEHQDLEKMVNEEMEKLTRKF